MRPRAAAGNAGPAQQIEQQRFRLIAAVMPEQQHIVSSMGKDLVARHSCRSLEAQAAVSVDSDMLEHETDGKAPAIIGAEFRPTIGIRGQAVMDMHRLKTVAKTESGQNMQENDRIAASRQPDTEALAGCRPGRENRRNPLREATWGTVP